MALKTKKKQQKIKLTKSLVKTKKTAPKKTVKKVAKKAVAKKKIVNKKSTKKASIQKKIPSKNVLRLGRLLTLAGLKELKREELLAEVC